MKFVSATHVGRVRQENEDFLIAQDNIFIVADGMGGHNAGDVASKMAAQCAFKVASLTRSEDPLVIIKKAIEAANKKVIDKANQIEAQSGMGTTLTMVIIKDKTAYVGHIGDSRAYLLREGKLKQITEDHSLVSEMVKQGKITNKEAREHPYRNVITKAVGSDINVVPDLFSLEIMDKDRLLLASDGLTSMVKDSQIKKILNENELKEASEKLIKAANDKGGADNTTVVLIDIDDANIVEKTPKLPRKSLFKSLFTPVVAVVIISAIIIGAYFFKNNSYYLSSYKGKVAMYQGLPFNLLGLRLGRVSYVSSLEYKMLDSAIKKRLQKKIIVKNRQEGLEAIDDMGADLDQ